MSQASNHDPAPAASHAVPAIAAVGTSLAGISLQDWLAIAGLVFLALQATYMLWRWRRDIRRDRAARAAGRVAEDTDASSL